MKFISLFAGIGGFDLGLERAGMECVGQVEYNPFCQRVLKHHWPHVKLVEDIHDVTADSFGAVDLICGGFPCQPFSNAGKRKGTADDRYLWPEMLRVIQAYRPAWVLGENVAGIVNMELDNVLSDLEREGYETQAFIIPACAVDAKHERKRVWIVANAAIRENDGREGRVVAEAEERRESFNATSFTCRQNVSDSNGSGFGERRRVKEFKRPSCYACEWLSESNVGRVANGVPGRVDRLRSLGNAVVPQVVEVIGKAIQRAHVGFNFYRRNKMNKKEEKKFNEGFLFGIAQCLYHGDSCTPQVVETLQAAGVNRKEIEESEIEDFDKKYFTEDILLELDKYNAGKN